MADKFEDLRTYIAIVEAGGVNAAAIKLEIAKSATSRRLSDLEERLGVTLIRRTTRTFELTEAGRTFYSESQRILADMAQVEARMRIGDLDPDDEIILAVDRGLLTFLMPSLSAFHDENQGLAIVVSSEVRDADRRVLIVTTSGVDPERHSRKIGEYRSSVFAAPSYIERSAPLRSPADLAEHDGIIVSGSSGSWQFGTGPAIRPRVVITVPDADAALAAARAGIGLAHLPVFLAEESVGSRDLVACLNDRDVTSVVMASKPGNPSAAVDRLLDHLIATFAT